MKDLFITKWALTEGIVSDKWDGKVNERGYVYAEKRRYSSFKLGHGAHATMEAAKIEAEKMRLRKIESYKRSIDKLEQLSF